MDRWHVDFIDDELTALALDQLRDRDALLLGRHTYDAFAGAWPGRDGEFADGSTPWRVRGLHDHADRRSDEHDDHRR
jgi:hypothetical protein